MNDGERLQSECRVCVYIYIYIPFRKKHDCINKKNYIQKYVLFLLLVELHLDVTSFLMYFLILYTSTKRKAMISQKTICNNILL